MTNEVKKYRFFNPWVPQKYRKGINGKKILVLGASYYCYKITCPHFQDCTNVEKKDSSFFDALCPQYTTANRFLHDEPTYTTGETPAYTRFARLLMPFTESDENIWDYPAITNYLQYLVPCNKDVDGNLRYGKTLPSYLSERDFLAFIDTLQELKPDIVISWGTTTLSRIREDNEYVSKQDIEECYKKTKGYYCRMNIPKIEHTIFLFNCYHPSSPDWYSCFDDAAKYMKELLNLNSAT